MFCREHVVQLHREIKAIHRSGAELVVIGSGAPTFVAGFRETTKYDGPLYCDTERVAFRAAELRRSRLLNFTPMAAARAVRALSRGFRQGRMQGDDGQQGGVVVVRPDGAIAYYHQSSGAGDNAEPQEIIAALEATARRT
jgi:hypothetical protein